MLLLLTLPYAISIFIFRPQPLALASPSRWRVPAQLVTFPAADGSRLTAWWSPAKKGSPTILLLHGRSGNLADRSTVLQRLAADRIGFLALDYRGYGATTGEPSERALYEDAAAAFAWLHRQPANGCVIVVGQSLGNAAATQLAASEKVLALALASPFTSLPGAAAAKYPYLPISYFPWRRNRFDVRKHLDRVKEPVLLAVAADDELVPLSDAQALVGSLERRPGWSTFEGGHGLLLQRLTQSGKLQRFAKAQVCPAR